MMRMNSSDPSDSKSKVTTWLTMSALLCVFFGLLAPFVDYVLAYFDLLSESYFVAFTPLRIISMVLLGSAVVLGTLALIILSRGKKLICYICAVATIILGTVFGFLEYGGCKLIGHFLSKREESTEVKTSEYQIGYLTDKVLKYAQEHNGYFPEADKWCKELIISIPGLTPESFSRYTQKNGHFIGFAFNENINGLKLAEVPKNIVLLFESEGPLNLNGGTQLFESNRSNRKVAIPVSFADGAFGIYWIEFKEAECRTINGNYERRSLQWYP